MRGLPTHLVLELNVGTVAFSELGLVGVFCNLDYSPDIVAYKPYLVENIVELIFP